LTVCHKEPAAAVAACVRVLCRETVVLIDVGDQESNILRLQPALVMTQEQLARALLTVSAALVACY